MIPDDLLKYEILPYVNNPEFYLTLQLNKHINQLCKDGITNINIEINKRHMECLYVIKHYKIYVKFDMQGLVVNENYLEEYFAGKNIIKEIVMNSNTIISEAYHTKLAERYNVTFNELVPVQVFARNYNIMRVMDGLGGLAFSN
jgi:hypothetical protein